LLNCYLSKFTVAHHEHSIHFVRIEIAEKGFFKMQFDKVHKDDKWPYKMQDNKMVYLADSEELVTNATTTRKCFLLQWHSLGKQVGLQT
jgi:hypothetical protein